MIVVVVVGAVVLFGLAVAATVMEIVGLLGVAGFLRMRRCHGCGHLLPTAARSLPTCPYCRHLHQPHQVRLQHLLPGDW